MSSIGPLAAHPIIPVIVIDDADHATDLARALADGGITCAEITLRTPAALDAIRAMASVAGFTVGAGTVLSPEQVDAVAVAGAQFVVSPGFDLEIVDACRARGLGVLPGVATASEAMAALRAGIDVVKFFPADRLGGLDTIRALAAPLPQLGFVPSGGVTRASLLEYLADPAVPAVSGSWMAPRQLVNDRAFGEIQRLAADSSIAIGAR